MIRGYSMFEGLPEAKAILSHAFDWAKASKNPSICDNQKLHKDLKRSIYQLDLIDRAKDKKTAVATYGASQAGKSYLIAALAKGSNEHLIVKLGNASFDFIKDINPPGGKESTALVTRFTTDSEILNEKFPIKVEIFTVFDLEKLISNSFIFDVLLDDQVTVEALVEQLDRDLGDIEKKPLSFQCTFQMNVEDIYEIEDYCSRKFQSNVYHQALRQVDFWNRIELLLFNADKARAVKALQLLWMNLNPYTNLFSLLLSELERIGHPKVIWVGLESICKKFGTSWRRDENSILNVSTITALGSGTDKSIGVLLNGVKTSTITSSALCALVSEIVFPIERPDNMLFDASDLLDFPGARSRKAQTIASLVGNKTDLPLDNFLRGKVSFLFDKYVAQFGISAMLLCTGPSNQEVVGLAQLVEDWVIVTHGLKSESRASVPCSLFFILTKLDHEFTNSLGIDVGPDRWDTRIKASLEEPFSGKHSFKTSWVTQWTKSAPFRNVFWLRNPNADQSSIMDYVGEPGRSLEKQIRPDKADFIGRLRGSFLESTLAQKYFQEPSRAWDQGLRLNDGGATYLISKIEAITSQGLHKNQLHEVYKQTLAWRKDDLQLFYRKMDLEGLRGTQEKAAKSFIVSCDGLIKRKRLGEFISLFNIRDDEVQDIFKISRMKFERMKTARRTVADPLDPVEGVMDPELAEMLGIAITEREPEKSDQANHLAVSFSTTLLSIFLEQWSERLIESVSVGNLNDYLHVDRSFVAGLVGEFRSAAERTGLTDTLQEIVEETAQISAGDQSGWLWYQISRFTTKFNDFINYGGHMAEGPFHIKFLDGRSKLIFDAVEKPDRLEEISDLKHDFTIQGFRDWIAAVQAMIMDNSMDAGFGDSERRENEVLGGLLSTLEQISTEAEN